MSDVRNIAVFDMSTTGERLAAEEVDFGQIEHAYRVLNANLELLDREEALYDRD